MDGNGRLVGSTLAHGGAPYRAPARATTLVLALLLALPGTARAEQARPLDADGRWRSFEVRSPGRTVLFRAPFRAGCRYLVVAEGRTLTRPVLEVGPPEAVFWSDDAGRPPSPAEAAGGGEDAVPDPGRPTARVTFYAERDQVLEVRVGGFSALTGKGRLRVLTIGPEGRTLPAHRRVLAATTTLAQVGDLWVGEEDAWDLEVAPGATYEARTRPGTAGRLRLALEELPSGRRLAARGPTVEEPFPRLRFTVPTAAPGEEAPRLRLVVAGVDAGAGTYGIRIDEVAPSRDEPSPASPEAAGPPEVLDADALRFRAGPGDLAFLYLPSCPPLSPHTLVRAVEGQGWLPVDPHGDPLVGARASMRTPEDAAVAWFRPHVPGTFRFLEAARGELQVHAAGSLPPAPILIGTGEDPEVLARTDGSWKTLGIGLCMPGWSYIFVGVARRPAALAMRARTLDGTTLAFRPAVGEGLSRVAGMGPSMRFRVPSAQVVLLQAQGRGWEGSPLLRRASD